MPTEKSAADPATSKQISIPAPNFKTVSMEIRGTAPYVQHKFSAKALLAIKQKQMAGSTAKKGAKREARNFESEYEEAIHRATEGWYGIPAPAFRNASISACRTVGFKMTHAKLALFIEADGFDATEGTPLVKIKGKPEKHESYVRLESGVVSLAIRPMWREWSALLRIRFDADMFNETDVANLIMRVGAQVGIGEGRPDSKNSAGLGWGTFQIVQEKAQKVAA